MKRHINYTHSHGHIGKPHEQTHSHGHIDEAWEETKI